MRATLTLVNAPTAAIVKTKSQSPFFSSLPPFAPLLAAFLERFLPLLLNTTRFISAFIYQSWPTTTRLPIVRCSVLHTAIHSEGSGGSEVCAAPYNALSFYARFPFPTMQFKIFRMPFVAHRLKNLGQSLMVQRGRRIFGFRCTYVLIENPSKTGILFWCQAQKSSITMESSFINVTSQHHLSQFWQFPSLTIPEWSVLPFWSDFRVWKLDMPSTTPSFARAPPAPSGPRQERPNYLMSRWGRRYPNDWTTTWEKVVPCLSPL